MWSDAEDITLEWIETYEKIYKKQREYARQSTFPRITQYTLKPNKMQVSAIQALDSIRAKGAKKALLISATGTGKTYLSAFDLRNYNARRALFIVHREQIANQALESYKNVFGDTRTMGILSGNSNFISTPFITIIELSSSIYLSIFFIMWHLISIITHHLYNNLSIF